MTDRPADKVISWSLSTYQLIVLAYPSSFRRDFGESMAQVFGDAIRDAWRRGGPGAVAMVWVRTVVDVLRSLAPAYASEARGPLFTAAIGLGLFYICTLGGVVGYGALEFREFYEPPAFSTFGGPHANEDDLLAAYSQAMSGEFGTYRRFTAVAGLSLAVLLGVTAALFGLWQKSLLHGTGVLALGSALTIVALHVLPTIWFPLDRYPAGALWLMGGGIPLAAGTSLLVILLGRFRRARPNGI